MTFYLIEYCFSFLAILYFSLYVLHAASACVCKSACFLSFFIYLSSLNLVMYLIYYHQCFMFVAIFAYNVNSCALDISLYFVCEKKTNKSWHRKKAYRGHFLIGQKPHCLLLCARIKESYDYSLKKLTDHQKLNASNIFEIVPGTLRMLMLLHASILWLGKSGKSDTRYLGCKKVTCFHD